MAGHDSDRFRSARRSARRADRPRAFLTRRSEASARTSTASAPRRDRHGRGLRSPLLPQHVPASRTRAEQFDDAVLEAVADLEDRWPGRLADVEFAVDEVPAVPADGGVTPGPEVVLDDRVPLARLIPPGVDGRGRPTKARVVLYRRPLEARSLDPVDLGDLALEVLTELLGDATGEDGPPGW